MSVKLFILGNGDATTIKSAITQHTDQAEVYAPSTKNLSSSFQQNISDQDTVALIADNETGSILEDIPETALKELDKAKAVYLAQPDIKKLMDHKVYTTDLEKLKPLPFRNTKLASFLHANQVSTRSLNNPTRSDTKDINAEIATKPGLVGSVYSLNCDAYTNSVLEFVDHMTKVAKAAS